MNAQLNEQLQDWKDTEFERFVASYAAQNHDPSAPENHRQLGVYFEKPKPTGAVKAEDLRAA